MARRSAVCIVDYPRAKKNPEVYVVAPANTPFQEELNEKYCEK